MFNWGGGEYVMNDLSGYTTNVLQEKVVQCDELESFQELLSHLPEESNKWKEKINRIIKDNGYSKTEFAGLCKVSRTAVSKWCNGSIPNGRDDFIRIGFAAHYSLAELNAFLQRYGKYPALYAKSLEDSVYIFILNSESLPHTYAYCENIMLRIKEEMCGLSSDQKTYYDTEELNNRLLSLESIDMLINFVKSHAAIYQSAYAKLYATINAFVELNNCDFVTGEIYSIDFLARVQHWSSSFRQCISEIRQNKWFPMRRKIIALGLHLNMTTNQINEILCLAQMEPLYAKNIVESAIIYAVEDADTNNLICCDGGTELCDHVRGILERLNIQDAEKLLNDI